MAGIQLPFSEVGIALSVIVLGLAVAFRLSLPELAALALVDYFIYVIDVAAGDKIPRKNGPGITHSDILVINKTDLAPLVGADLGVMERDAKKMRGEGPIVFAQVTKGIGTKEIAEAVLRAWSGTVGTTA